MHVACGDAQVQGVEGELKWGSEESLQLCNCDIVIHAGVGCSGDAATVVTDVPITTQHLAPVRTVKSLAHQAEHRCSAHWLGPCLW